MILQTGTQYWFYMDSTSGSSTLLYGRGDPFSGGNLYTDNSSGSYAVQTTFDAAFTLSGTQANPGPIPGSGLLSYLVLGFGGAAAFRKRLRGGAASVLASLRRRSSLAVSKAAS
jgi:hypothetical protein